MEKIEFEKLSDEQRQFLINGYSEIFRKMLDDAVKTRKEAEEKIGLRRLQGSGDSFWKFIWRSLARLVGNIFLSFFFKIDPVFLDYDVKDKTPEEKEHYYRRCSVQKLGYSCMVDIEKGLNKLLEYLNSDDPSKALRMLGDINRWEVNMSKHESYPKANYDMLITILLTAKENNVRLLAYECFTKNYIMHMERETSLGYQYEFIPDLEKLHEEYRRRWG